MYERSETNSILKEQTKKNLLSVERPSIEPASKGAMNPWSGNPLCEGKGDGGLRIHCKSFQFDKKIHKNQKFLQV